MRYNAQKSKVGAYYSTPIYAFRCKCHLCSGWFEIRTDPQNAAYVIQEGARRQESDWDPEAEGGHAAWDTEGAAAAQGIQEGDVIAALEKDTDQASVAKRNQSRLDELSAASDRMSKDPWAVSRGLRAKFRVEKRQALERQAADDGVLDKYGLHEGIYLEESGEERGEAVAEWTAARVGRGLSTTVGAAEKGKEESLGETIRANTKRKFDAFANTTMPRRQRLPRKVSPPPESARTPEKAAKPAAPPPASALGGLAGYGSDSDSD